MLCDILVWMLQYSKKKIGHENVKKLNSKVTYLWQFGFFFSAAQNSPEFNTYPFYRFLYPIICVAISGPVLFHR